MSEPAAESPPVRSSPNLFRLLKLRVWLGDIVRPNEVQVTLFWAGVIGFLGACSSILFRIASDFLNFLFTQKHGGYAAGFGDLGWWQRLLIPTFGGLLAGATLLFATRLSRKASSTDYMEAVVLGDGDVPVRLSLVKSLSALFSIASGASIGREGPMVQLSAMLASAVGRVIKLPIPRRRLIVACGAAAGIASAYNAPIAGSLFVAEIVLGSLAMESFGPLVFSSVVATLTVRQFFGASALYKTAEFSLNSVWEILPYCFLGLVCGAASPLFLRGLKLSEKAFALSKLPLPARLAAGGLGVGILATMHPEVCGNGYTLAESILRGDWLWKGLLYVLVLKLLATASTFGSGAVGGVFTPTLCIGASIGYLYGVGVEHVWHATALSPSALALVAMGAFLAATTHAPIMAILMIFELTLDYQIILPLMLCCVIAYYTSLGFEKKSIYSDALKRKGGGLFEQQMSNLRVANFMRESPASVQVTASFEQVAQNFVTNRFNYLYVTDKNLRFAGAICLHDIKAYLNQPEIAHIVTARDLIREEFTTLTPEVSLVDALKTFSHHDGERIPVIDNSKTQKLIGSISKTDLILSLAENSTAKEAPPALAA